MSDTALPYVRWKGRQLSRVLVGHNPVKGGSHFSDALSQEMREWHEDMEHGLALLQRCEEVGITVAQFGGEIMHDLLRAHKRRGGRLQWIATLYCNERGTVAFGQRLALEEELRQLLRMDPPPMGIQHFGENTDRLYFEGRLGEVRERLKRVRESGLLVGVCTHLPEVVEEVASQDWDLDFYQVSFYTAYSGTRRKGVDRSDEIFEDEDRARMVEMIQGVDKPCLAFKVLGANRKCGSREKVQEALQFVFNQIKETDVVCLGMWQKHMDQVGINASLVREILGEGSADSSEEGR